MRKTEAILCGGVALLLLLPGRSAGECFIPEPPCREFEMAAVVLDGTVEATETIPEHAAAGTDGASPVVTPSRRVRVRVLRAWKGIDAKTAVVDLFESSIVHGPSLEPGRRYLVWARRDDQGRLWAQGCGQTKPVEKAGSDLEWLESRTPAGAGSLFGTVLVRDERTNTTGIAGIDVLISRADRPDLSAKTDASGHFTLTGLTEGTYMLRLAVPAGFQMLSPSEGQVTIVVEDARACHQASFVLGGRGDPTREPNAAAPPQGPARRPAIVG